MARMSIDDQVLRDPRVIRLARILQWSRRETLGCLLDVWALCYDRAWHVIPVDDIDVAAERPGFHVDMIAVGLARHHEDGVYIAGAAKRIAYLVDSETNGRKGGERSGQVRRASVRMVTNDEGSANLPDSLPDADPVPDPVPDGVRRGKRASPVVGFKETIDVFHQRYLAAYGATPTWNRKTGIQMKDLLRVHGQAEVTRRIAVMFTSPPTFLTGPLDFGTFVQHFDKMVVATVRRGPVNHAQVAVDAQISRAENFKRLAGLPHEYDGDRPNECRLCGGPRDAELHTEDTPPYERAEGASGQHDEEDDVPWA